MAKHTIQPPYYPIVYVRGYAMTADEREETFHDAYYGFAATSVEKREAAPPTYYEADLFEGMLVRLMKLDRYYADAANRGVERFHDNPSRSIWVCRFYDEDYFRETVRSIEDHARDLRTMIFDRIPRELEEVGVDLGTDRENYKVILIAHSMGGLVCRTLIQNLMPSEGLDPGQWIHRLVTIGTPHRGIDLGRMPDALEDIVTKKLNPFDSNIFREERMRSYLKLEKKKGKKHLYDIHSVADRFPIKRCLNIIGSDHGSYGVVRHVTGSFSDGLVKQDRAYMVSGEAPAAGSEYPDEQRAYWANVHRAHSGRRGIVNSYETFENLQRFLFGNLVGQIWLENLSIHTELTGKQRAFYDVEFLFSIRNTAVFLHRREQDPCENSIRFRREDAPERLLLHTTFMDSRLRSETQKKADPYSHFAMTLRIVEHITEDQFLWDRQYPGRVLLSEQIEVRVDGAAKQLNGAAIQYRYFSGDGAWMNAEPLDAQPDSPFSHHFLFPVRDTKAFEADIAIRAGVWPNPDLTRD